MDQVRVLTNAPTEGNAGVILLLLAYPKNEQENLTPAQLRILKSIIETEFP
ncbi:MAG: hypothetical protein H7A48_06045 [Akkermansiaceae bacterium]|nr:hypothetical protein [Akkermansiaceae bacterium]